MNNLVSECLKAFSKRQKMLLFVLMLLTVALGLIYPLLLSSDPRSVLDISREYRPGELSDEDVIAPADFSYIDVAATSDDVELAARSVLPRFAYSIAASIEIRNRAEAFTAAVADGTLSSFVENEGLNDIENVAGRLSSLEESDRMMLTSLISEGIRDLVNEGIYSSDDISNVVAGGYRYIEVEESDIPFSNAGKQIAVSDLADQDDLYHKVLAEGSRLYPDLEAIYIDLVSDAVLLLSGPNVFYDSVLTTALREEAAASVPPVLVEIHRGDYILQRDTVVTDQQLRTIQRIYDSSLVTIPVLKVIGYLVYLVLFTCMLVYLLFFYIKYRYRLSLYTTIFLIGIDLSLTAAFFISRYLPLYGINYIDPFFPFIVMPAFAASITRKRRVGFAVALTLAGFAVLYPSSRLFTFFYLIGSIEICLMLTRFGNERMDIIYQTVFSAIAVAFVTALVSFIYDQSFQLIFTSSIVAVLNVVFTFIVISIVLPIIEKIFNIPTAFRLHELSFTDTPTLNRLMQVAPGTFNHSKNVSEMAYEACKAIHANADLARVGALYHDIGKSEHPEYFIENQNGKNAHDEINKTLSAAIIKSHVKLGVEKAKEIGLPQEVIDIISEHHGNDLIKYFYNEAVREAKESRSGGMVSEEDFRYNGRIPSTEESAVVMLADCTEAATRTMKNPNHQKYDKFISLIIIDKMNHKQLNNSELTINDLEKIKESFIHYLLGRDHQRIEYDKE